MSRAPWTILRIVTTPGPVQYRITYSPTVQLRPAIPSSSRARPSLGNSASLSSASATRSATRPAARSLSTAIENQISSRSVVACGVRSILAVTPGLQTRAVPGEKCFHRFPFNRRATVDAFLDDASEVGDLGRTTVGAG